MRVSTPKYCTEPFQLIFFSFNKKKNDWWKGFGGSLKVVYMSESFERTKISIFNENGQCLNANLT